jgi:hypothetical protein
MDRGARLEEDGASVRVRRRRLSRQSLLWMPFGLLPVLAGPGLATCSLAQTVAAAEPSGHVWLDVKGAPLPFQGDDEILEFLRTAKVVDRKEIKEGLNRPLLLVLEHDGTRVRAIFRFAHTKKRRTRVGGRYYPRFLDHYDSDGAAYDLARQIGIDTVPPTVIRRIGVKEGSLQVWPEDARNETKSDFRPPSPIRWMKQQWDMDLFDNLIFNADRNSANILAGPDYEFWLTDHGRAFQPMAELLSPEKLKIINRQTWDRLQALSDDELKEIVREHLDTEQLRTLVQRRKLLVELVEGLVADKGEAKVFY